MSLPRLTRRSDGKVFRIVLQARSPNGPVSLIADEDPPFEQVETTNDRLLVDFQAGDAREAREARGRRAFEAYNASVGGLTWDGKPIPGWDAITPKIREAWCVAAETARKD